MESSSAPGQYKSAYRKYNKWNSWNKNKESNGQGGEGFEASNDFGSPQQKQSGGNYGSSSSGGANMPETSFDLGKNKRVTVRQFRNVNLIDIREYYKDSNGDLKPGKKGISLTEEMFDSLLSNYRNIDDALRRLGSFRSHAVSANAFDSLKQVEINTENKIQESSTAGTLLVDNSGSVNNEQELSIGTKRTAPASEESKAGTKKTKETNSSTPAPPQEEQHKKVEALENSANLVIPTKPVKKDVDSDDDFANDLENELAN